MSEASAAPNREREREWSPSSGIAWKVASAGRGHSAPVVWGDRVFLTTAIEGDAVPGHKAPEHMDRGKPFLHPDSVGVDRRNTLKVIALDAFIAALDKRSGKQVWRTRRDVQVSWSTPITQCNRQIANYPI